LTGYPQSYSQLIHNSVICSNTAHRQKYRAFLTWARIIDPVNRDTGRLVVWSHPAFANRRVYARNDKEIICVDLAQK
jgi:hypothetical protein